MLRNKYWLIDWLIDWHDDANVSKYFDEAVSEQESVDLPMCYYVKSGLLMRKWRPPDYPTWRRMVCGAPKWCWVCVSSFWGWRASVVSSGRSAATAGWIYGSYVVETIIVGEGNLLYDQNRSLYCKSMRFSPEMDMSYTFLNPPADKLNYAPGGHKTQIQDGRHPKGGIP